MERGWRRRKEPLRTRSVTGLLAFLLDRRRVALDAQNIEAATTCGSLDPRRSETVHRPRSRSGDHSFRPGRRASAAVDPARRGYRRAASRPALETRNGTTKLRTQRTHVAAVACPSRMTDPWLISVRMTPTTTAMRIVRLRLRRWAQKANASRMTARRDGVGGPGGAEGVDAGRVGD